MKSILYTESWVPYNDTFVRSKLVLEYPKNVVFAMQYYKKFLEKHLTETYVTFPYAERFDVKELSRVDWLNSLIVLDSNDQLLVAPDPFKKLVNLDRRLRYKEAEKCIFGPFRILPRVLGWFKCDWIIWIVVAVVLVSREIWTRAIKNQYVVMG